MIGKTSLRLKSRNPIRIHAFGEFGPMVSVGGRLGQAPSPNVSWMMAMKKKSEGAVDLDEARLRQQALGTKLRQMFDEVVNEPVPDDFLEILRRADESAPERER